MSKILGYHAMLAQEKKLETALQFEHHPAKAAVIEEELNSLADLIAEEETRRRTLILSPPKTEEEAFAEATALHDASVGEPREWEIADIQAVLDQYRAGGDRAAYFVLAKHLGRKFSSTMFYVGHFQFMETRGARGFWNSQRKARELYAAGDETLLAELNALWLARKVDSE
jgi:hypothetical protein